MNNELPHKSAVELASLVRNSQVSARDVVTAHLDRIDELNGAVNAIVSLRDRDEVLADADAADKLQASGAPTGPLHGLPVAVKDLEDVAGLPTRSGSLVTSDRPAVRDGIVAERLRSAGAIFVGKTNTPEFGTGSHTFNEVFGTTLNLWDLSRSAGGSSGGAAAALAARTLPIADGSDFGGSLRNPASFCNVVGLRPSIGRVARPADRSTHLLRLGMCGPMGRNVADTALMLSAMAGPDRRDPLSLAGDPAGFAEPLGAVSKAKVGWGGDLDLFTCEPEVLNVCLAAVASFEAAGATVVNAKPNLENAESVFRVLRGLSYRDLSRQLPGGLWRSTKSSVVENIEYGLNLSVDDVLDAENQRAGLHIEMDRFFADHDVLALPSAQVAPFPADWECPTEIAGVKMGDYLDWMMACCVITPTGCPAISVPAGFTEDGLPVGLQLVAPIGAERRLLEIASAFEAASPHHDQCPEIALGGQGRATGFGG